MWTEAPSLKEVSDFHFTQLKTLQLTNDNESHRSTDAINLMASSSKHGLLFIGVSNGFKVLSIENILHVDGAHENKNHATNDYAAKFVSCDSPILLALSSDEKTLAVCVNRNSNSVADLYDIGAFANTQETPIPFLNVQLSSNACILRDFAWNPIAEGMFSFCLSDGSLYVHELNGMKLTIQGAVQNAAATAICWSPKGKQLVVGKSNGSFSQFKPTLQEVKNIPPPDSNMQLTVSSICWLSTSQFAVTYYRTGDSEERSPFLVIVSTPKGAPVTYVNYGDVCFGFSGNVDRRYFMHFENLWNMLLCASTDSVEIAVLGDAPAWIPWDIRDERKAILPESSGATQAVGLSVLYSSQQRIIISEIENYPPMPIMFVVTNNGLLVAFHMVNVSPGCPSLVKQAVPISREGERKRLGIDRNSALPSFSPQSTAVATALSISSIHQSPAQSTLSTTSDAQQNVLQQTVPKSPFSQARKISTSSMSFGAQIPAEQSSPDSERVHKSAKQTLPVTPTTNPTPSVSAFKVTPTPHSVTDPPEDDADSQSSYMLAIIEEVSSFQKEFQDLKACAGSLASIGTPREMTELKEQSLILQDFQVDMTETMKSLNSDIHCLKNGLLESFVLVEDANSRERRKTDHTYLSILRDRALDPMTAQRMQNINQHYLYLSSQLQEVANRLDQDWFEYLQDKQTKQETVRHLSSTEAIYKTLVNNQNIITNFQRSIAHISDKVEKWKLEKLSNRKNRSPFIKRSDPEELSKLADAFLKTKISPDEDNKQHISTRKAPPEIQNALRSFLSSSQVSTVRPTVIYSPSQSRFISKTSLMMEKAKSTQKKKSTNELPETAQQSVQDQRFVSGEPHYEDITPPDSPNSFQETYAIIELSGEKSSQREGTLPCTSRADQSAGIFSSPEQTSFKPFVAKPAAVTLTTDASNPNQFNKPVFIKPSATSFSSPFALAPLSQTNLSPSPQLSPSDSSVITPKEVSQSKAGSSTIPSTPSLQGVSATTGQQKSPLTSTPKIIQKAETLNQGPTKSTFSFFTPSASSTCIETPAPSTSFLPPTATGQDMSFNQQMISSSASFLPVVSSDSNTFRLSGASNVPNQLIHSRPFADSSSQVFVVEKGKISSAVPSDLKENKISIGGSGISTFNTIVSVSTGPLIQTNLLATFIQTSTNTAQTTSTGLSTTLTASKPFVPEPVKALSSVSTTSTNALPTTSTSSNILGQHSTNVGISIQRNLPENTSLFEQVLTAKPISTSEYATTTSPTIEKLKASPQTLCQETNTTASPAVGQCITTTETSPSRTSTLTPVASVFGQITPTTATTAAVIPVLAQSVSTTVTTTPMFGQTIAPTTIVSTVFVKPADSTATVSSVSEQTTSVALPIFSKQTATTTTSAFAQPASATTTSILAQPTVTTTASMFGQATASVFSQPAVTTVASVFGQSIVTTSSFPQPTSTAPVSVFSQPTTTTVASVFGQATATTSTFLGQGATATTASFFGQTPGFFSGTVSSTTTQSSFFNKPVTGGSVFGQSPTFGASTAVSNTSMPFGQSSGSFFSQTPTTSQATGFGGATSGGFGVANVGNTTGFGSAQAFGQSSFGQMQGSFGLTKSVFGQSTPTAVQPTSPSNSSAFGQPENVFGQGSFFSGLGGKPAAQDATKNVFGVSSFGKPSSSLSLGGFGASSFGAKPSGSFTGSFSSGGGSVAQSGFGAFQQSPQKTGFGAAPSFGGSPSFGGGGSTFGSAPAFGSGLSAFASSQQTANFANFASASSPTFGSLASQSPAFGQGNAFGGGGSGPAFGNTSFGGQASGFGSAGKPETNSSAFTQWRN